MRRRSEGEPTGDVGMPARRIERSFVSAGDEGEPGLTGRCSGAGAAVLQMEASALLLMPAASFYCPRDVESAVTSTSTRGALREARGLTDGACSKS